MNPSDCPVVIQARRVSEKSTDLLRALRQLKRQMRLCSACPHNGDCPVIQQFNREVDAAINQITIEWGLQ